MTKSRAILLAAILGLITLMAAGKYLQDAPLPVSTTSSSTQTEQRYSLWVKRPEAAAKWAFNRGKRKTQLTRWRQVRSFESKTVCEEHIPIWKERNPNKEFFDVQCFKTGFDPNVKRK